MEGGGSSVDASTNASDTVAVDDGDSGAPPTTVAGSTNDRRVFVGNLPFSATEQTISELFARAGKVSKSEIIQFKKSKRSKGYGFVTFESEQDAAKAIELFTGFIWEERELTVELQGRSDDRKETNQNNSGIANPTTKPEPSIQVKKKPKPDLPSKGTNKPTNESRKSKNKKDKAKPVVAVGKDKAKEAGKIKGSLLTSRHSANAVAPIQDDASTGEDMLRIFEDTSTKAPNQPIAKAAQQQNSIAIVGSSKTAKHTSVTIPENEVDERFKVFVGNIPFSATEESLRQLFSNAGDIVNVTIVTKRKRSAGYAFVCYKNEEGAAKAVQVFHEIELDNRPLKVERYYSRDAADPATDLATHLNKRLKMSHHNDEVNIGNESSGTRSQTVMHDLPFGKAGLTRHEPAKEERPPRVRVTVVEKRDRNELSKRKLSQSAPIPSGNLEDTPLFFEDRSPSTSMAKERQKAKNSDFSKHKKDKKQKLSHDPIQAPDKRRKTGKERYVPARVVVVEVDEALQDHRVGKNIANVVPPPALNRRENTQPAPLVKEILSTSTVGKTLDISGHGTSKYNSSMDEMERENQPILINTSTDFPIEHFSNLGATSPESTPYFETTLALESCSPLTLLPNQDPNSKEQGVRNQVDLLEAMPQPIDSRRQEVFASPTITSSRAKATVWSKVEGLHDKWGSLLMAEENHVARSTNFNMKLDRIRRHAVYPADIVTWTDEPGSHNLFSTHYSFSSRHPGAGNLKRKADVALSDAVETLSPTRALNTSQSPSNSFFEVNDHEILGKGENSVVCLGRFGQTVVSVKKLERNSNKVFARDLQRLKNTEYSRNVARYFYENATKDHIILFMEYGELTLQSHVEGGKSRQWLNTLSTFQLVKQILGGLEFLHKAGVFHGNLKPSNILLSESLTEEYSSRVMITDYGQYPSNQQGINSASCFQPREMLIGGAGKITLTADVFSFGCIACYHLSWGGHPFGDDKSERIANILRGKQSINADDVVFRDLIEMMVATYPNQRPNLQMIKSHLYFWTPHKRLTFLCDIFERLIRTNNGMNTHENAAPFVFGGLHWHQRLHPVIQKVIPRSNNSSTILELLRFMRNTLRHLSEHSPAVQEQVGFQPKSILATFNFPNLLIYFYYYAKESSLSEDPNFATYFR